jgi:hypothetical protein
MDVTWERPFPLYFVSLLSLTPLRNGSSGRMRGAPPPVLMIIIHASNVWMKNRVFKS